MHYVLAYEIYIYMLKMTLPRLLIKIPFFGRKFAKHVFFSNWHQLVPHSHEWTVALVTYQVHLMNEDFYQDLPKRTKKIQQTRIRIAWHCIYKDGEISCHFFLLHFVEWKSNKGRKRMSYVNKLFHGNRMKNIAKLKSCFVDRDGWRDCVCSEKWFKLSSKTK